MTSLIDIALLASALGCGLMAGFFLAFSICVMRALGALPPAQGIAAMQSINVAVINRWFLTVFFGVAVACVFLIVAALVQQHARAAYMLAGSLLYLIGALLVTMVFNVPRNNALAAAAPTSPEAAALWADYLGAWTRWNHVRTIAALGAAGAFTLGLARQLLPRDAIEPIKAVYAPMQARMFELWSTFGIDDLRVIADFLVCSTDAAIECAKRVRNETASAPPGRCRPSDKSK